MTATVPQPTPLTEALRGLYTFPTPGSLDAQNVAVAARNAAADLGTIVRLIDRSEHALVVTQERDTLAKARTVLHALADALGKA